MQPAVPAVEAERVSHSYARAGLAVPALRDVSLAVASGEVVAVVGPSGSGKSTLLFLLAGLERPQSGRVRLAGTDWAELEGPERARLRRRACGFVCQGMALLPQATAAENVEVPLLLAGFPGEQRRAKTLEALAGVGLEGEGGKLPDQLSGGQQQRVAIARALVTDPLVLLADEPTGNLDSATGQAITRLIVEKAAERGAAVVIVTHDPSVAAHADRTLELRSGRLAGSRRDPRRRSGP